MASNWAGRDILIKTDARRLILFKLAIIMIFRIHAFIVNWIYQSQLNISICFLFFKLAKITYAQYPVAKRIGIPKVP